MHIPTNVDEKKLQEWKQRLPKRLHHFMDNFFGSCREYAPDVSFRIYLQDTDLYGLFKWEYREYRGRLIEAYCDITGWPKSTKSREVDAVRIDVRAIDHKGQ